MKEHAKKALKHDTKVLGKTVPTMLIIGLFLVGGGSAALLSTFGTVSGTASIDRAITFDEGTDLTYDFSDQTTVAGETTVETRTVDNNADVSASYKFATSGTELGVDARIYRDLGERSFALINNDSEVDDHDLAADTTVNVDYDSASDHVTFTFDKADFSNHGAAGPVLAYDSDNDGTYDFQVDMSASEIPDYYPYDNEWGSSYEFKSDGGPDYSDTHKGVSFSTDEDETVVTMEVDREKLGDTFSFLASTGSSKAGGTSAHPTKDLSVDDTELVHTFGPQAGTGAANDLEEGTVTRTYQNGEVTFNFSDPEASPVLGIDSNNDGTYDFQFDYNGVAVDYYDHGEDAENLWTYSTEYKGDSSPYLKPEIDGEDNNLNWDNGAPEGISISGGKHTDFVAITIDTNRLDDTFRYDVGQNGDAFPGKDAGDSSQAEVVTTGVETLDSEESQDYTFVNDFAINLEEDGYTVSTDVVPVTP